ncbi:DNA polymerase V [Pseudomonas duriflava]|uniref:DNA polymerase V n=1 Tax=Pseudomonas duriflava TaxID=459528 RepID=A0A562QP72_9PSED|nr:S24 family peptidase [Pseudomonas duriflava]TWI58558.1 DNA polymerase V [Pseudomonas duriflava]
MSITVLGRNERLRHLLPDVGQLRISGFRSAAGVWEDHPVPLERLAARAALPLWVIRVDDDSLLSFGLYPGDRLIVDREVAYRPGHLAVTEVNGRYEVRRLQEDQQGGWLLRGGARHIRPIDCTHDEALDVFGVVLFVVSYKPQPDGTLSTARLAG